MNKIFSVLVFFSFIGTNLHAQTPNFQWAESFGGTDDELGNSIATDASGNVYVTGSYRGTVDLDPGNGTLNFTSNGSTDIFIQKLDPNGNLLWATSIGGSSFEEGRGISIDPAGNAYLFGSYVDTVDFDPGVATFNLISDVTTAFVLKLDANGDFIWAVSVQTIDQMYPYTLTTDASSNVYLTGQFHGVVDFNPGVGVYTLDANSDDIFIMKLDADANFLWAKTLIDGGLDYAYSIKTDPSGNVYVTGIFGGTLDFNPSGSTYNLTSNGQKDIFILKLDTDGLFVWAKSIGATSNDYGMSLALDGGGNVYIAGSFQSDTVDFDPGVGIFNIINSGSNDIFVLKLDNDGNFLSAYSFGGASSDGAAGIATDATGNIYVGGGYSGTVDFDPGVGVFNLTSVGSSDLFILKLDSASNFIWALSTAGTGYQSMSSIALDDMDNVSAIGVFNDTVEVDPSGGGYTLISNGGYDVYVMKFGASVIGNTVDYDKYEQVSLYPNPAGNELTFGFELEGQRMITIYNSLGKKVIEFESEKKAETIDVAELAAGTYIYSIHSVEDKSILGSGSFVKE